MYKEKINEIVEQYDAAYGSSISKEIRENTKKSLLNVANEEGSSVTITVQSYVLYTYVTIESDNKKFTQVFKGNAGGIGVGGGKTSGMMFLSSQISLEEMMKKTTSFQINATVGFVNINIFDSSSNPIAHIVGSGAQIGGFIGGGTASWE